MFTDPESLLIFCLVKGPSLFWDCKGKNLFRLCKTYFFIFCFALFQPSQNNPLTHFRAAKVSRLFDCANGLCEYPLVYL